MNKYDIKDLLKFLADELRGYNDMRGGGNLGTAIQGMLQYNAIKEAREDFKPILMDISMALNKIANSLEITQEETPNNVEG